MRSWPFYRDLSEPERGTLRWFLFARRARSLQLLEDTCRIFSPLF